jgi:PhnB protein
LEIDKKGENAVIKLNTYLNFAGRTEEAFNFYKSVFGGNFSSLVRFKEMPMPGFTLPKKDEDKLMHVALPVGHDVLMASDMLDSVGHKFVPGNNVYISIQTDSQAEADRIFTGLSAGGAVEMPMADQTWGDYYGSFTDKFGVQWMVMYSHPKEK